MITAIYWTGIVVAVLALLNLLFDDSHRADKNDQKPTDNKIL